MKKLIFIIFVVFISVFSLYSSIEFKKILSTIDFLINDSLLKKIVKDLIYYLLMQGFIIFYTFQIFFLMKKITGEIKFFSLFKFIFLTFLSYIAVYVFVSILDFNSFELENLMSTEECKANVILCVSLLNLDSPLKLSFKFLFISLIQGLYLKKIFEKLFVWHTFSFIIIPTLIILIEIFRIYLINYTGKNFVINLIAFILNYLILLFGGYFMTKFSKFKEIITIII